MAESGSEKTEAPTPRRRQEARQEGSVARSQDLTAASTLLAGILALHYLGLGLLGGMRTTLEVMLNSRTTANPTRPDDLGSLMAFGGWIMIRAAGPMVLCITAVALLVTVGQVGFVVTTKPLEPNLGKLNPLRGLSHFLDARAGFRLGMSLGKIAIVGLIAAVLIVRDVPMILALAGLEPMQLMGAACELVYSLALRLAMVLLVMALIDWVFQKWQHERDLRMSKQEIKEEMRRMEGDPMIKQRRGRVARQLALQRVASAVPKADVVVTNPTHFAVALRYDSSTMRAPKVVAKGADLLAARIRQLAVIHGIPMVERKALAQAIYKTVEVGQEVPSQYYGAIAEILAYVYRLSGRKSA